MFSESKPCEVLKCGARMRLYWVLHEHANDYGRISKFNSEKYSFKVQLEPGHYHLIVALPKALNGVADSAFRKLGLNKKFSFLSPDDSRYTLYAKLNLEQKGFTMFQTKTKVDPTKCEHVGIWFQVLNSPGMTGKDAQLANLRIQLSCHTMLRKLFVRCALYRLEPETDSVHPGDAWHTLSDELHQSKLEGEAVVARKVLCDRYLTSDYTTTTLTDKQDSSISTTGRHEMWDHAASTNSIASPSSTQVEYDTATNVGDSHGHMLSWSDSDDEYWFRNERVPSLPAQQPFDSTLVKRPLTVGGEVKTMAEARRPLTVGGVVASTAELRAPTNTDSLPGAQGSQVPVLNRLRRSITTAPSVEKPTTRMHRVGDLKPPLASVQNDTTVPRSRGINRTAASRELLRKLRKEKLAENTLPKVSLVRQRSAPGISTPVQPEKGSSEFSVWRQLSSNRATDATNVSDVSRSRGRSIQFNENPLQDVNLKNSNVLIRTAQRAAVRRLLTSGMEIQAPYSAIVSPFQFAVLVAQLPPRLRVRKWCKQYDLDRDGANIDRFTGSGSGLQRPQLLLIEDECECIFGALLEEGFEFTGSDFKGSHYAMVFYQSKETGEFCTYGLNAMDRYIRRVDRTGVWIGPGKEFALYLDEDLKVGTSGPSVDFGSPRLSSTDTFRCLKVELWG